MTALYTGSFDPVTLGHADIISRSARMFDRFIIAVVHNPEKQPLFTLEERVAFLKELTAGINHIEVDAYSGLLAMYVVHKKVDVIIRGVRSAADFEYEAGMASFNRLMTGTIETLLMPTEPSLMHISSSAVREAASHIYLSGFDDKVLDCWVPSFVKKALKARYTR